MTYYSIKIICLFLSIILFKLTNQCINISHKDHCDNSASKGCCKGRDYCKHKPLGCGYVCSDVVCIKEGKTCDIQEDGCCYGTKCVAYSKTCKKCSFNKCTTTDDCCNGHCANGKCYEYTDCKK